MTVSRRPCARSCTSASPAGSRRMDLELEQEHDEIVGYHLEQAYRARAELALAGEPELRLARRVGTRLASAGRRAAAHGDASGAANLLEGRRRCFRPRQASGRVSSSSSASP